MTARTERKYALNSQQLRRLSQRLSASLTIDPYCSNGPYHIRSIYFDGPKWPAIWERLVAQVHAANTEFDSTTVDLINLSWNVKERSVIRSSNKAEPLAQKSARTCSIRGEPNSAMFH